jgi:DNA-binding transcriptional LysR family regulator
MQPRTARSVADLELRRLRHLLAFAEELNFSRAAERLLIAGLSLSQQKALERDLGVRLFDRDRRSAALTQAGTVLLPHIRSLLEQPDDLQSRAARMSGSEPVRLGHVNWLPRRPDRSRAWSGAVHIEAWIAPSPHPGRPGRRRQPGLAVRWVRTQDLEHGLNARLIGADLGLWSGTAAKSAHRSRRGRRPSPTVSATSVSTRQTPICLTATPKTVAGYRTRQQALALSAVCRLTAQRPLTSLDRSPTVE